MITVQRIAIFFKNAKQKQAVLADNDGGMDTTRPPPHTSTQGARKKALHLFGNSGRRPAASQLWAAANKSIVDREIDLRNPDPKCRVGVRRTVVADLYKQLDDKTREMWEKEAQKAKDKPHNPDQCYV